MFCLTERACQRCSTRVRYPLGVRFTLEDGDILDIGMEVSAVFIVVTGQYQIKAPVTITIAIYKQSLITHIDCMVIKNVLSVY